MQATNLPTSLGQWKRYFEQTFKVISDLLPVVAFGQNKINLILKNLQKFSELFLSKHAPSVPVKEGRVLFEFFKTCAAFVSFLYQYTDDNFLQYFFSYNVNYQFEELCSLWNCWSVQSSMLIINSFSDISTLNYANYLDLNKIYESITPVLGKLPLVVSKALRNKMDDILLLLGQVPPMNEAETPGIIQHSQFENIKEIGHGAYATVNLAKMEPSGKEVAVKELKQVQLSNRNVVSLKRELNALLRLNHPNVLEFIGVTVTPPFCIATKYLNNGSLFDLLRGDETISPNAKQRIALCMARGLEYLDAMRFIHRDFKSQNVLIDNELNAVICDFGISRQIGPKMTCELGTVQWTAPEVLAPSLTNYDTSADTYSFAIVLWELTTGTVPFYGLHPIQVAATVLQKGARPELTDDGNSPQIKKLIEQCWSQDPRQRPKMANIRQTLESGKASFSDIDLPEFQKYVNATKAEHERIMKIAHESAAREEALLLEKLHSMNPLDSTALKLLQQLYQIDYPLTLTLFEDILRLSNQTLSIPVQDAAFDIMKQILSREDIAEVIDPNLIVDELVTMMESQPLFVITAVKLVADKIRNIKGMIQKFLDKPQSHVTLEMIQALISQNKERVPADLIIHIFESLHGQFAVAFFRFAMAMFGPMKAMLPLACRTLVYISLFVKEMGKLCETEVEIVKEMIAIPEMNNEGRGSLQQTLDMISVVVVNSDIGEVTEKMAAVIFKFLVRTCFESNNGDGPILQLLCICAKVVGIRQTISQQGNVWNLVIKGLNDGKGENFSSALNLIDHIPICQNDKTRKEIWETLISCYVKTKNIEITHVIGSLMKRASNSELDIAKLTPIIIDGIKSDNEQFCVTALKIAKAMNNENYLNLIHEKLWVHLTQQITNKNFTICKSIGKLVAKMAEKMETIPFDPEFFTAVLVFLYDSETPFDTAGPFIVFLTLSCRIIDILIFLQKRYFVKYIEQLPWRYEAEAKIAEAVEFCAASLTKFYPE